MFNHYFETKILDRVAGNIKMFKNTSLACQQCVAMTQMMKGNNQFRISMFYQFQNLWTKLTLVDLAE